MDSIDLLHLPIDNVIAGCAWESQLSQAQELGYCWELFRRALDEKDEVAWEGVLFQYKALLLKWIHGAFPGIGEDEADEVFQETTVIFWQSLGRHGDGAVARKFAHVGVLLKYLRCCSITAAQTLRRKQIRYSRVEAVWCDLEQLSNSDESRSLETRVLEALSREQTLHQVQEWVSRSVQDKKEQDVLRLTFEENLKPAEIAARHPTEFPTAHEVCKVLERVLKRARRNLGSWYRND